VRLYSETTTAITIVADSKCLLVSLGPHCAYFRMRKLKPQVAKASTVRVEKTFALAVQHSHRNLS